MALEEASQLSSTSVFKVRETGIEHFRAKIVELKVIRYLQISPFLAPPAFEIKTRSQTALKGESTVLSCEAKGEKPIGILWNMNNKRLDSLVDPR